MKIAIVDDEALFRELEKKLLEERSTRDEIYVFSSTKELLANDVEFDLLLLDIEMPDANGITFAKEHCLRYTQVLFVTSHDELVYDAFYRNILGFIVKDQLKEKLVEKVTEIEEQLQREGTITFRTDYGDAALRIRLIQYIYTEYDSIYVLVNRPYRIHTKSLKGLVKSLPICFFQIDRNIIVNLRNVVEIYKSNHTIVMQNGESIKVSERKWTDFKKAYVNAMVSE